MGLLHLRAPSGVVIGFSLPLHEAIDGQWRRGELQRVTGDGSPWEGDEYDLGDGPDVPGDPGKPGTPPRPDGNAPKRDWQAYAAAVGAVSAEEAGKLTRAELITRCTPPEMSPASGGD
ncbi:MAG TPA: hypothetical protein VKU77_33775 [Streptosporangiaceae bacterium]|nr:hypothetical protein [Streptosporangiaceae bacterium]